MENGKLIMTIRTFEVNPLQENCYVVSDETKETIIIDCGAFYKAEFRAITDYIEQNGLKPVAHLLTHAHFDHAFGAGLVFEKYGLKARFHVGDDGMFKHISEQPFIYGQHEALQRDFGPAGEHVETSHSITFGTHSFSVIHTPGHTQGGVCYYCAEERVLFSGDSLFCQSIGRTDYPGGNYEQLILSIRALLSSLPDGVTIYPGHGPATSSEAERNNNPWIR